MITTMKDDLTIVTRVPDVDVALLLPIAQHLHLHLLRVLRTRALTAIAARSLL
jgi:hypothetical protein